MRNKKSKDVGDYAGIERKIYGYIFIALLGAIAFVVFLRQLVRGVAGDWIVGFLGETFHLQDQEAMLIYQYTVRNNMEIFIFVAVALCFLFLCRRIITNFRRYFDEVNVGIDALIQDESKEIELSAEMAFTAQKLNALRQTLVKRQQDANLAEQRKNDLVMYLAHDLKTPLTSVIGYLNLLEEAPDMPVTQRAKYLNITLEKAYRLEGLIDEFFEITRYNLAKITLSPRNIDLHYLLSQMVDEFYPQLAAKGQEAKITAARDLTVYGDGDKLARVFNNILKNAVAYSAAKSLIEIGAQVWEEKIVITFTNEGSIPKEKLASIFDKFYRLDSARSSATGGAGLGLAVAKEIVVLHGGQIYACSDAGKTVFTVELPAKKGA